MGERVGQVPFSNFSPSPRMDVGIEKVWSETIFYLEEHEYSGKKILRQLFFFTNSFSYILGKSMVHN